MVVLHSNVTMKSARSSWEGTFEYKGATNQVASFKVEEKPMGGIPGFPYESIMLGLLLGAFVLWMLQRRR